MMDASAPITDAPEDTGPPRNVEAEQAFLGCRK